MECDCYYDLALVFLSIWIGITLGGFATVLYPRFDRYKDLSFKDALKVLNEPSMCACGVKISGIQSWPLIGWISHRGKCKTCGQKIPKYDLIFEIGGGIWVFFHAFIFSWFGIFLGGLSYILLILLLKKKYFILPTMIYIFSSIILILVNKFW